MVEIRYANSSALSETWDVTIPKAEMNLRRYDRHLEKSIWRHNSVTDHLIRIKFGKLVQLTVKGRNQNREYSSIYMADVCLQQPEVVIYRSWIHMSGQNLVRKIVFTFKCETSQNWKAKVYLRSCTWPPSWKIYITSSLFSFVNICVV